MIWVSSDQLTGGCGAKGNKKPLKNRFLQKWGGGEGGQHRPEKPGHHPPSSHQQHSRKHNKRAPQRRHTHALTMSDWENKTSGAKTKTHPKKPTISKNKNKN